MHISKDPADYRYRPPAARTRRAGLTIEAFVALLAVLPSAVLLVAGDGLPVWLLVPAVAFLAYRLARLVVLFRHDWRDAASLGTEASTE